MDSNELELFRQQTQTFACQIKYLEEVDSTNAWALRESAPDHGATVYIADQQSAGRGRRGRQWQSPAGGNLYFSLSRRFIRREDLSCLSLVTGLAVANTLRTLGYQNIGLKWPNDIFHHEKKLGGILIESATIDARQISLVIGVGINLKMPDDIVIDQSWTDLQHIDSVSCPTPIKLAAELIKHLMPAIQHFEQTGFASFIDQWQQVDVLRGKPIVVVNGQSQTLGVANDIDHTGALLVDSKHGQIRCVAGEVSIRAH